MRDKPSGANNIVSVVPVIDRSNRRNATRVPTAQCCGLYDRLMPAFDLQGLIGHLSAHQHMALALVFTAAFLESIAVIGVVVPGSTAVFLAGALTGIGILRVEWVLGLWVLGAVLGEQARRLKRV